MVMNNEVAGESVFGNVDEALAERIVSRAKKNSGEPEQPMSAVDRVDTNRINVNKPKKRHVSIIKIAILAGLMLIVLCVFVKSKSLKSNSLKSKS